MVYGLLRQGGCQKPCNFENGPEVDERKTAAEGYMKEYWNPRLLIALAAGTGCLVLWCFVISVCAAITVCKRRLNRRRNETRTRNIEIGPPILNRPFHVAGNGPQGNQDLEMQAGDLPLPREAEEDSNPTPPPFPSVEENVYEDMERGVSRPIPFTTGSRNLRGLEEPTLGARPRTGRMSYTGLDYGRAEMEGAFPVWRELPPPPPSPPSYEEALDSLRMGLRSTQRGLRDQLRAWEEGVANTGEIRREHAPTPNGQGAV